MNQSNPKIRETVIWILGIHAEGRAERPPEDLFIFGLWGRVFRC